MKIKPTLAALVIALAAAAVAPLQAQTEMPTKGAIRSRPHAPAPPVARIIPKVDTTHGDVRVDNYFWMRDRADPETIAYLLPRTHTPTA